MVSAKAGSLPVTAVPAASVTLATVPSSTAMVSGPSSGQKHR